MFEAAPVPQGWLDPATSFEHCSLSLTSPPDAGQRAMVSIHVRELAVRGAARSPGGMFGFSHLKCWEVYGVAWAAVNGGTDQLP